MDIGVTLEVKNKREWRNWLNKNHNKEKEIWVVFYKKNTGRQTMSLTEAMDEAVCFGWIDSIEKGMDKDKFALRFTPRKLNSNWSKPNIERVERLIREGKMTEFGLRKFPSTQ